MKTDSTIPTRERRLRSWLFRSLPLLPVYVVLACVILTFLFPATVQVGITGGFFPRQIYSIPSPDGRTTLIVTQRAMFPLDELFDPASVVTVEIRDVASGRVLDSIRLELVEDSDLGKPNVEWTPEAARVTEIDHNSKRTFTLNRNTLLQ